MAFRRTLSKRLFPPSIPQYPSPITTFVHSPLPPPSKSLYPHESTSAGFFRQRRAINNHSFPNALPSFLSLPVGEILRAKLKSINAASHQLPRLDELSPSHSAAEEGFRLGAADAKRVVRFAQMERIKERLRNTPASTIPYDEFVRVCGNVCGNGETGVEFAKALDESGNVIVLGGVVFLRPDQVAKSMERVIWESIGMPNDPRRKELERLKKQKGWIDKKAESMVRGELYCGLGFMVLQTLGFMRLTFWELSWDVMEPICFFVTSLHFALAYCFFLRTSKEPSFEGYFQRRFKVKQNKLIRIHNFDVHRYNHLSEAFYPNCNGPAPQVHG